MNGPRSRMGLTGIIRIEDIEHYHWQLAESEMRRHTLAIGNRLSLAAALELACIERQVVTGDNGNVALVRLPNCPVWQLVRAVRWPGRRKPAKLRNGSAVLTTLPVRPNDIWWTERLHELQQELNENGFGVNFARALTGAVGEMVDNVWLHSATDLPGLLAYQIRRRKFAFSVADLGIGVLSSLRKNAQFRYLNSSSMRQRSSAVESPLNRTPRNGMVVEGYDCIFRSGGRKLAINSPSKPGTLELFWGTSDAGKDRWGKGSKWLTSKLTR